MLEMYNTGTSPTAGSEDFWDHNWEGMSLEVLLSDCDRICEGLPLYPLLQGSARPNRLFLEGGGTGHWVRLFHPRGQPPSSDHSFESVWKFSANMRLQVAHPA